MLSWYQGEATQAPTFNYRHAKLTDEQVARCMVAVPWSPCVFKNGHRKEANFISAKYVGLDFDEGMTISQATENIFCDVKCWIGPTKSHAKKKGGIVADRFRVLIELEETITDLQVYKEVVRELVTRYESDPQCVDGARFFFPCTHIHAAIDGDLWDFDKEAILAKIKEQKKKDEQKRRESERFFEKHRQLGTVPLRVKLALTRPIEQGNRNQTFYGIAKDLFKLGFDEIRIADMILSSPTYTGDNKYQNEIKTTVASAKRGL